MLNVFTLLEQVFVFERYGEVLVLLQNSLYAGALVGLVGGIIGDRIGRKATLVAALLTMGISTVIIGLLPTYAQIGVLAPLLLAICRFGQGFGLGRDLGDGARRIQIRHMHDQRVEGRAALGGIDPRDCLSVAGVPCKAVNRLGRDGHDIAARQQDRRAGQAHLVWQQSFGLHP